MKKKMILITGGAGFVGSNLIEFLLKKTNFKIISLDNYSSGFKKNHIKNTRIKYIKGDTKNIERYIKNPSLINSIFHFGEFARIYQSFISMNECINSNSIGTNAISASSFLTQANISSNVEQGKLLASGKTFFPACSL